MGMTPWNRLRKANTSPKLQLFSILYLQLANLSLPLWSTLHSTAHSRDRYHRRDEAKTGYYAGFIVSYPFVYLCNSLSKRYAQEAIFFAAELQLCAVGSSLWSNRSEAPLVFGTLGLAAAIMSFGLSRHFGRWFSAAVCKEYSMEHWNHKGRYGRNIWRIKHSTGHVHIFSFICSICSFRSSRCIFRSYPYRGNGCYIRVPPVFCQSCLILTGASDLW